MGAQDITTELLTNALFLLARHPKSGREFAPNLLAVPRKTSQQKAFKLQM
jgi:hypothetical protein